MSKEKHVFLFEKEKKEKFVYALLIDCIGYFSYIVPGLAEITDLFWAPLSAVLVFSLFRINPKLAIIGGISVLIEEFTPGFDFIPTALLIWTFIYVINRRETIQLYFKKEESKLEIIDDDES